MARAQLPAPSWDPARTRVFALSVCAYPGAGSSWSHGPDDDFIAMLQARGVPPANLVYLRDEAATRADVESALTAHLVGCTDPEETLIFYYCGHGDNSAGTLNFCVYDHEEAGALPCGSLFSLAERHYSGARALLFSDCCFSGLLVHEALKRAGRLAYGVMASQMAAQTSTGQWTFTATLIEGFSGRMECDLDGDGLLLWSELARWQESRMAEEAGQLSTSATVGLPATLVLATAKPHRPAPPPRRKGAPEYAPGTRLLAREGGREDAAWVPAVVLACRRGLHFIAEGEEDFGGGEERWAHSEEIKPAGCDKQGWFVKYEDGATELVEVGYLRWPGEEEPAGALGEVQEGASAEAMWLQGSDARFGAAWFPCIVTHVY